MIRRILSDVPLFQLQGSIVLESPMPRRLVLSSTMEYVDNNRRLIPLYPIRQLHDRHYSRNKNNVRYQRMICRSFQFGQNLKRARVCHRRGVGHTEIWFDRMTKSAITVLKFSQLERLTRQSFHCSDPRAFTGLAVH